MRAFVKTLGVGSLATFAVLAAVGVAVLTYVHTTVGDIRKDFAATDLRQKSDIGLAVQHVADLRHAVHAAAEGHGEQTHIEERLDSAETHLATLREGHEAAGQEFAGMALAIYAPAVADIRLWADEGHDGHAPVAPETREAMIARLGAAYSDLREVFADASAASEHRLAESASRLDRFRSAVTLGFVLLGGVLVTMFVLAFRSQRHEHRAHEARSQLHEAINSIADGFALFAPDGRLLLCNARYSAFFPSLRDTIAQGKRFSDMIRETVSAGDLPDAEEDREQWLSARLALFDQPTGVPFETRLRDGRTVQVSERKLKNGSVVAVVRDVTDLRRGETELRAVSDELRHNNMLLDAALSNMGQGLAMFDSDYRLIVCNQRYLDIFEFPEELGKPGTDLDTIVRACHGRGSPEDGIDEVLAWRRELARLRYEVTDVEFLRNGRVVQVHHRPMPDGGSLATYDDITESHRAQEALRHAKEEAEIANRAKSEFLANVSHELRTPLNAIIGFAEVLEGQMFGPLGDARYKSYAGDIGESGRHLLSLINDILDLSKVESGKYPLVDEKVVLNEVVHSCIRVVGERARASGVRIEDELPMALPALRGDERAMKQVLLNLLTNAVKFTSEGGKIVVAAAVRNDGNLYLTVSDTGIGMGPDDLKKAMTPFGQVDSTLSRKYEGTGLGLPLTKRLAELHGGWLAIDSAPGKGTCVTVGLPAERLIPADQADLPPISQSAG